MTPKIGNHHAVEVEAEAAVQAAIAVVTGQGKIVLAVEQSTGVSVAGEDNLSVRLNDDAPRLIVISPKVGDDLAVGAEAVAGSAVGGAAVVQAAIRVVTGQGKI